MDPVAFGLVYLTVGFGISAVLFDEAVPVSIWLPPPPAVMPDRFTVCCAASSRIAGGFGMIFRVGGSFTGVTVSTNVSVMLRTVPPIVFVTVTVIVVVPFRSAAGALVIVRVDPLPVRLRFASGTSVVLFDVAVMASNAVPASPTLKENDSGVSSGVD